MIATKALPSTRVATSAPSVRSQLDPRWNKARALLAQGRRVASEFADEIERLRDVHLGEGHGGSRQANGFYIQESHDETLDRSEGFKAQVALQLGISPATAYRYISWAKAIRICKQIEQAPKGEVIELETGSYEVTPEVRERARALCENISTGAVPMNRAMPAVAGMFGVAGGGTGGKAATNHPQNMWAGVIKLRGSMQPKHWRQGKLPNGKSWDDLVQQWDQLVRQLPDELRACTLAALKQR